MKEKKWDFDTCLNYMKEKRDIVKPNEGFKKQLIDYYNKNIGNLINEDKEKEKDKDKE